MHPFTQVWAELLRNGLTTSPWLWRNWGHTIQVWAGAADCGWGRWAAHWGWGRWLSLGLKLFHEALFLLSEVSGSETLRPQRCSPGPPSPPYCFSKLMGLLMVCRKIITTFFLLWPPFLFSESIPAFLGSLVVILFWKSGQYGTMSAWLLLPGLQISRMAPTPCLLQFRNALPGLVCSVSPPFNSPLVCFTNRLQLLTAVTSLGSQLWDLIHPLQTHAFQGGRHYCSCWRAMSHMLTKRPLIPHRKCAP